MSIQIEEGKTYKARNGLLIGPMTAVPESESYDNRFPWRGCCPGKALAFLYAEDGTYGNSRDRNLDLIAVWPSYDVKSAIVEKALSLVSGDRRSAYGTPEDNFERIAKFWQAYFENTGRGDVKITAKDISPLMRLMKEARLCNTPHHPDSFTDLIGYALTGAEINGLKADDFS